MRELFSDCEVGREPRWPLVMRLLAASIVLHVVSIACLIYVPPVRDAFNIVSLVGRASFVDKPYNKTVFGEDIQMIAVSPKFQYPQGYFAIGLPGVSLVPAPTPDPFAPKIISEMTPMKALGFPSPSPSPAASPSPAVATAKASPSASPSASKDGAVAADKKTGDQKPDDKARDDAQKQLDQTAAANNVDLPTEDEINRKPIKDLTAKVNDLKKDGKLDLDKSFDVTIEAALDVQGKLQKPTVTQKSGDPKLAEIATEAIGALNDSGLLIYLKGVNDGKPTKVTFVISQNADALVAKVETELGSDDAARQQAKAFSLLLAAGLKLREGKDEEALIKSTKATHDGKKLVFNFSMPRQDVVELIKKQLAAATPVKQG